MTPTMYLTIRRSDVAESLGKNATHLIDHQEVGKTNFQRAARTEVGQVIKLGKSQWLVEDVKLDSSIADLAGYFLNDLTITVRRNLPV